MAKKWIAGLLCLLMGVLAACSGSGEKPGQGGKEVPKEASKPVELNVWGGYPEMDVMFKKAADDYKKLHPNVTINVLSFNLRDYEKKLATSLPSDSSAEIINIGLPFISGFIDAGLIDEPPAKVTEFVKGGAFRPVSVELTSYKGKVYGVPLFTGQAAIFYNRDHFKEAGITKPPESIDDLIEYAKKLAKTDANGNVVRAGISLRLFGGGSGVAEKFSILMENMGGSMIKETAAGKYTNGYDNDAGRKTLQMHVDLVHKYKVDDPKLKRDAEAFELGIASMFARESWVVGDIAKKAPNLNYGTVKMPSSSVFGGNNLFVPKAANNKDVAWDFISYLLKPEYQTFLLDEVGWLPLRIDVDYSEIVKKKPGLEGFMVKDPNYRLYTRPTIKVFDEVETKMAAKLEKAMANPAMVDNPEGIAKAIKEMADETDAILKGAGLYGK